MEEKERQEQTVTAAGGDFAGLTEECEVENVEKIHG